MLFVAAVFTVVTYAQNNEGNSTLLSCISNSTVLDGNSTVVTTSGNSGLNNSVTDNNTCTPVADNDNSVANVTKIPDSGSGSTSENETNISTYTNKTGLQITALDPQTSGIKEYFNITNYGCYPVDLKAWQLEEKHCETNYTFTKDVIVQPSQTLQVFTKSGTDSKNVFHMGEKEHIFNSPHDEAKLVYETDYTV